MERASSDNVRKKRQVLRRIPPLMALPTPSSPSAPQNNSTASPGAATQTSAYGCDCGCPPCPQVPAGRGSGGGGSGSGGFSSEPVRYSNGEVKVIAADLTSNGFGVKWGQTRCYSNQLTSQTDGHNGNGWQVVEWPLTPSPRTRQPQTHPQKSNFLSVTRNNNCKKL